MGSVDSELESLDQNATKTEVNRPSWNLIRMIMEKDVRGRKGGGRGNWRVVGEEKMSSIHNVCK